MPRPTLSELPPAPTGKAEWPWTAQVTETIPGRVRSPLLHINSVGISGSRFIEKGKVMRTIRRPLVKLMHKSTPWLHRYWPGRIKNPVFVVGCPRSGTTILGQILAETPDFLYLNEPRYIWCHVNPRLDIWAYRNPIKQGVLYWDSDDLNHQDTASLARWFHLELFVRRRRRLIEKMPEHVFRMRWLSAMFPKAKFIHVIRNGRDVALSLAEALTRWFPRGYWESSRHYGIFRDYAAQRPGLWRKLGYITERADNYPRALFVWLCSATEGRNAGYELGPEKYMEVRYEALVSDAEHELRRVFDFLNEHWVSVVSEYADRVLRTDSLHKPDPDPALTRAIAGDLLEELGYESVPVVERIEPATLLSHTH